MPFVAVILLIRSIQTLTLRQIRDSIEQTRKILNNQSNMLDLVDDDDSETTVVKITINYAEKNRQFIFAVKKVFSIPVISYLNL